MLTNVYTPQIGGVTRSVQQYQEELRRQGHHVLVVAPDYEENPEQEEGVIRVPAIPRFYLDVYSLPIPSLSLLLPQVREFQPDIVHVHHPFLLGSTGQLIAADLNVPLVYTHHTRYSAYIETKTNIPRPMEEGIVELIVGFCELSDGVVAPSEGIRQLLIQKGVTSRIDVIPTGVELERFEKASGDRFRKTHSISPETFVVGHVGRLSPEKNALFLTRAVARFLKEHPKARFVVVGDGPSRSEMEQCLKEKGLLEQALFVGFLEGEKLADAYASFDVFAFASHSETQGMVLAEAMAAGVPVVAVNATGVQDFLQDGVNGRLIEFDDERQFAASLTSIIDASEEERRQLRAGALKSAEQASQPRCTRRMVEFYKELTAGTPRTSQSEWERMLKRWEASWELWRIRTQALATAAHESLSFQSDDPLESDSTGANLSI
jgi:Glycosyltransferase